MCIAEVPMSERRHQVRLSCCCVSSLVAWEQESSARVGSGFRTGVWCHVVSVFGQFPLLTGNSLLLAPAGCGKK
jgi:hypothetical protein